MAFPTDIVLRTVIQSPYTTKGAELTWQELDGNFISIGDQLLSLADNIAPFDAAFPYVGGQIYYVSYNNNIWKFISATTQTGVTPGTDPLIWELSSIGQAIAAGTIIIKTMLQATTEAGAGQLAAGSTYLITGCYSIGSNTVDIYIKAKTATTFEAFGYCSYINSSMATAVECYIGYDLMGNYSGYTDFIFYLYNAQYDNEIRQTNGSDTLSKYPLDAPQYSAGIPGFTNNRLSNVEGTWTASKNRVVRLTAKDCTLNTTSDANANSTVLIFNTIIETGATVTVTSDISAYTFFAAGTMLFGAILQAHIDTNATVTISRASITGSIGRDMTFNTTNFVAGYGGISATGGFGSCEKGISTFVVRGDELLSVNPDGTGTINITDANFAGTIIITDTSLSVDIFTITHLFSTPPQQFALVNESANPVNVIHDITKIALQTQPTVISNNGFDRLMLTGNVSNSIVTELYHTTILP